MLAMRDTNYDCVGFYFKMWGGAAGYLRVSRANPNILASQREGLKGED